MIPALIELCGAALVVAGAWLLEPALAMVAAGLYLLYMVKDAR